MSGTNPHKAVCPMCKKNNTHKRKNAYGWYCHICNVAFRDPLIIEANVTEVP